MANIFDYLLWRGDLLLAEAPFQDVDGLILSCLAYHYFDRVLTPYDPTPVTIAEAARRVKELPREDLRIRDPQDVVLLQLMGKSPRFGHMELSLYVDHVDVAHEAQFSAITVALGDGTTFIAYRGTDLSMVGWKEDFNMIFQDFVPAQVAATRYLLFVAQHFEGEIRLGGHSKGGNLAVFAGAVCPERVKARILCVYNHDGPGFQEGMLGFSGYRKMLPKVRTFIPQSSLVGLMFYRGGDHVVVKSVQKGLLQHDPYSWEVLGPSFVSLENTTAGSKFVDITLKSWIKSLPVEKREKFIDSLFEILAAAHTDAQGEIVLSPGNAYRTLQTLKEEDPETRELIMDGFSLLIQATKQTAGVYARALQRAVEQRLRKIKEE